MRLLLLLTRPKAADLSPRERWGVRLFLLADAIVSLP
jgi:hypothetical protein